MRSCRSKGYLGLVHLGAANSTASSSSTTATTTATSATSGNGGGAGAAGSAEPSFLVCYDHFGHGQEVYCVRGSL